MSLIKRWAYVPVLRTREAELKGVREIPRGLLDWMLPVIEVTRSRRSKSNISASVAKSMDAVAGIFGQRPYIADLTSLASQQNAEIEDLLDPTNGFASWVGFVSASVPAHCIPSVHLTEPFDTDNFSEQVKGILRTHSSIAIRIPIYYSEFSSVINLARSLIGNLKRVVILLDAGYIKPVSADRDYLRFQQLCALIDGSDPPAVVSIGSSFPSSVVSEGYGGDAYGDFLLYEVSNSERLKSEFPSLDIKHGDYACVHPHDFEGTVTNWVPRVDVPLEKSVYYHRYRRNDGGYEKAARYCLSDAKYVELASWAQENIKAAARGSPIGRSPAHWIAVRVNMHIIRQLTRLTL